MKKRVLGLLLSCCMLLALLPATALAAGDTCPMCQSNDTTWTITETYHRLSCNACTGIIIPPEAHSWEDQLQTNATQRNIGLNVKSAATNPPKRISPK